MALTFGFLLLMEGYIQNKVYSGINEKGLDIFWTVTIYEIMKELGLPGLLYTKSFEQRDIFC
jgi:hypothetical protein